MGEAKRRNALLEQGAQAHEARSEARKVIHVKKFMDGKIAPEELHAMFAWAGKKCRCGTTPFVRCLSFAPFAELNERAPGMLVQMAIENNGTIPMVEFTYGKFVRIGEAYACGRCMRALERAAAKHPSWVLVEWQKAPTMSTQVQVPNV